MPLARIASVHGGVLPVVEHGSSVHTSVSHDSAGTPLLAAAASALISACGPPHTSWVPRATTWDPASTAAPTHGLGATSNRERRAASPSSASRPRRKVSLRSIVVVWAAKVFMLSLIHISEPTRL